MHENMRGVIDFLYVGEKERENKGREDYKVAYRKVKITRWCVKQFVLLIALTIYSTMYNIIRIFKLGFSKSEDVTNLHIVCYLQGPILCAIYP